MSSKQLLRLVGVLLGVLLLWGAVALASRRSDEGSSGERSIIPKIDTAAVDSVAFTGTKDSAVVRRVKGGREWQVNGHVADTGLVKQMLRALAGPNPSAELIARNPSSHPRLQVTEDSGRRVRVVAKGRVLMDVLTGKRATDGEGIYLRATGHPEVYVVRGDISTALARPTDEWRDRTIAKVATDSVSAIQISRGKQSYTLRRQSGRWRLSSGAVADSGAVANLLSNYRRVEAAGFASRAQQDSLTFNRRRRLARLLGQGGRPLLTLAFDSISSGLWVRVEQPGTEAGSEPYRLDYWTADQLTPPDSTLKKR